MTAAARKRPRGKEPKTRPEAPPKPRRGTKVSDLHAEWMKRPGYAAEYARLGPAYAQERARIAAQVAALSTPANDVSAKKSRAAQSGLTGEKLVAKYNAAALAAGVARLRKQHPPFIRTARGWIPAGKGGADYEGRMLDGSARAIAAEVKSCSSKVTFAMSEVEPHQRKDLDETMDDGGVALLIVVYGPERSVCQVDWWECRELRSLAREFLLDRAVTEATYLRRYVRGAGRAPDGPGDFGREDFEPVSQAQFAAVLGKGVVCR